MAVLHHFVGAPAAHDVHQVSGAKLHAMHAMDAVDGGQELERCIGAVPNRRRLQAVIAVQATQHVHAVCGLCIAGAIGFAKILKQAHAATVGGLSQGQQGVELFAKALFENLVRRALVDHAPLLNHVLQAVTHPGIGALAVTACATGFLVIAFHVFGHVQMRHEAHIGLVDAHAKGNGGDHDPALFPQEAVLVLLAKFGIHAGVVSQGMHALLAQLRCNFFDPSA